MTRDIITILLLASPLLLAGCSDGQPPGAQSATSASPDVIDDTLVRENNRGVALMGSFDYQSAHDVFAPLHEQHPHNHDITVNLAIATLNRQDDGDEAAALALLNSVLDAEPSHSRARYCTGLLTLNAGDAQAALAHFLAAAQTNDSDAYAQYYAALSLSQTGDNEGARARFVRAIELDPYLRSASYGLFQTLQRIGDADGARTHLATFQKLANNPRAQLAEFKYTRMGPLSMAIAFDNPNAKPAPKADLERAFREPVELLPRTEWKTSHGAPRPSITAADIDGDGDIDIFLTGTTPRDRNLTNTVLLNDGGSFTIDESSPLNAIRNINAVL